jgi:hypothetical protein
MGDLSFGCREPDLAHRWPSRDSGKEGATKWMKEDREQRSDSRNSVFQQEATFYLLQQRADLSHVVCDGTQKLNCLRLFIASRSLSGLTTTK